MIPAEPPGAFLGLPNPNFSFGEGGADPGGDSRLGISPNFGFFSFTLFPFSSLFHLFFFPGNIAVLEPAQPRCGEVFLGVFFPDISVFCCFFRPKAATRGDFSRGTGGGFGFVGIFPSPPLHPFPHFNQGFSFV